MTDVETAWDHDDADNAETAGVANGGVRTTCVPGTYLCSASTPPGAGAQGMCGADAAARALSELGIDRR